MTSLTTPAKAPKARWLPWSVSIALHLALLLTLWQTDFFSRTIGGAANEAQPDAARVAEMQRYKERLRRQRLNAPMSDDQERLLVIQAQAKIKRELARRIQRVIDIHQTLDKNERAMRSRIARRPATALHPPDFNDIRGALASDRETELSLPDRQATAEELYAFLRRLERSSWSHYLDAKAAEVALRENAAFPETRQKVAPPSTLAPEIAELLRQFNLSGVYSTNSANPLQTIGDLAAYREFLAGILRQSALAESRLSKLIARADGERNVGADGFDYGDANAGDGGMWASPAAPHQSQPGKRTQRVLSREIVTAEALPGRRFSRKSPRRGWLYINTWYTIGPWESYGRNDFLDVHPPELSIDFDAVYHDGKTGRGIAENDDEPFYVSGEEVRLDGELRWHFMQSDSIHNRMPVTADAATYYAYTELYFEESMEMLVAIGTDDSGKLWINDRPIWQDRGFSYYYIDEHIQRFRFRQGVNKVMVRLENDGNGATGFSFLICPPEAVNAPLQ